MFPPDIKILVVDDMKTMRKIVMKCLTEIGYTNIHEADDGSTAWTAIEQSVASNDPFKLIISDWNMPQMALTFFKKFALTLL
jgi:two-component system, chemotaxis family, chemotaxis protein CheY